MMTADELDRVAAAVRVASGICLRPHQYAALEAAFERAGGSSAPYRVDDALRPGGGLLERLLDEVSVKETTFLRDREQLTAIDWHELAGRAGGQEVCVWSAGCATGEEAYSLALLACEAWPSREPPVRVVGTDLSASALEAARRGRYRERALREVDDVLRRRYFTRPGNGYEVGDRLRRLVSFQRHNLVTDHTPPTSLGACALVVCRNVFIYFEPSTADEVMALFRRSLTAGGSIVLGAADALVATGRVAPGRQPAPRPSAHRAPERREPSPRAVTVVPPPARAADNEHVVAALQAAHAGRYPEALRLAASALEQDAFDSHALFVRGFVELVAGAPHQAVLSFRAALYADPTFGLAAFMLGRAHDAGGERGQARRAYERSLRILKPGDHRHDYLLAQVDLKDVVAACRLRLSAAPAPVETR